MPNTALDAPIMATTQVIASNPGAHLASGGGHSSSSNNIVGVHYKVGKKIGEGSFGVIFEGECVVGVAGTRVQRHHSRLRTARTGADLQEQTSSTRRLLLSSLCVFRSLYPVMDTADPRNLANPMHHNCEMSTAATRS